jgi:hypothetical protein
VYQLAKALGVRPSELLEIGDRFTAFCLDRAVIYFGSTVDAALSKAESEAKNTKAAMAKQTMVINRYLGVQKFRDPAVQGPTRKTTE